VREKRRRSTREELTEDFRELDQYIERAYSLSRDRNVNLQIEAAKMRLEKIHRKLGITI
jgi:hypothetical protein